jgi:hypothetical protein
MGIFKRMKQTVSVFDLYPSSLSLTFQKSTGFKTLYGGLFSLIVLSFMSGIAFSGIKKLHNKELKSTMISKTFVDLYQDTKHHYFLKNGPKFVFNYFSNIIVIDQNKWLNEAFFRLALIKTDIGNFNNSTYLVDTDIPFERCNEGDILGQYGEFFLNSDISFCFPSNATIDSDLYLFGSESTKSRIFKSRIER